MYTPMPYFYGGLLCKFTDIGNNCVFLYFYYWNTLWIRFSLVGIAFWVDTGTGIAVQENCKPEMWH